MKQQLSVLHYNSSNTPRFSESSNKKFIEMGANNQYPHYLEELFASSSIHGAIVKGVSEMIYGEGLDSPTKDSNIEQWLKVRQIFGDETCLKRCALDLKLYGQCYFNIIWSQDRATISEVHHIPAATIRCGVADDEDNVKLFYHSTDWSNTRDEPKPIPAFNTSDRSAASQLLHIKMYNPLSFYYGLPDYLSSTNYIQVDANLSEFHLNNLENGMMPSMVMNFNGGVPTEDERVELESLIYQKFGGASNAGKILMTFNDGAESAPTIETFNISDAHKTYDYLTTEATTKILSGHRVTSPLLFGVRGSGTGFGNNAEEMKDSYDLFSKAVILPFQNIILEGLRPVLAASSITMDIHFKRFVPASFFEQKEEIVEERPRTFAAQPEKISLEDSNAWISHLSDKHSPMPMGWRLWKTEEVTDTAEDKWFHGLQKSRAFAESASSVNPYANYEEASEWDVISPKGFLFAVRYKYAETAKTPPVNPNYKSRDFCEAMMDISRGGALFRYDDILTMSIDGVNGQFAPAGQSQYDILEWKGGVYCRHGFERQIYVFAPDGELSEFGEVLEIEGDFDAVMRRVGDNPYVINEGFEDEAPIDTPSRGSLKY